MNKNDIEQKLKDLQTFDSVVIQPHINMSSVEPAVIIYKSEMNINDKVVPCYICGIGQFDDEKFVYSLSIDQMMFGGSYINIFSNIQDTINFFPVYISRLIDNLGCDIILNDEIRDKVEIYYEEDKFEEMDQLISDAFLINTLELFLEFKDEQENIENT